MGTWRLIICAVGLVFFSGATKAQETEEKENPVVEEKRDVDDLYDFLWLDPDKKVYVLQNKVHEKKNSFYTDLGYIRGLSSKYQDTSGFQLRSGFFFHEEWAVELFWNQYNNDNNETYDNLGKINGVVPFLRRIDQSLGAAIIWSPFYGKLNTFNKIIYYDLSFGAGIATVDTTSNAETAADPNLDTFKEENNIGAMLKADLKIHINKNWHINIEYQNQYIRERGPVSPAKGTNTFTDVVFGVGFSF